MSIFGSKKPDVELEIVPPGEAEKIASIRRTLVGDGPRSLRTLHPKDHGCVVADFIVSRDLRDEFQVGVFRQPGKTFRAAIRFSNASGTPANPDQPLGSLGMAIKLYGVEGDRLEPNDGERTQDFLMINQPVFPIANAGDFDARLKRQLVPPPRTAAIFQQMQTGRGQAFPSQDPPASPFDTVYFSAAPFLFGKGRAMKFSARPVNPVPGRPGDPAQDAHYLRTALRRRMELAAGKNICFDFQVQVRDSRDLRPDQDIEDVCTLWDERSHPFKTVARINIPPQDIGSRERPELLKFCETLFFTPWHGLKAHRPLGGINRARREAYQASAAVRGCPVSPPLPVAAGQR